MAGDVSVREEEQKSLFLRRKAQANPEEYGYTPREWARINAKDAAEHRKNVRLGLIAAILVLIAVLLLYAVYFLIIRSHDYNLSVPFSKDDPILGIPDTLSAESTVKSFASDLCVADSDVGTDRVAMDALSGGLFDLTSHEVIYGKDMFTTRSPASLTKVMTALVALKYGRLDDMVTVTETAKNVEFGSSVCDIKTGDVLSLKQLLYGMIIASGNDAALMVAEHVGGSVERFVEMMNEEALSIGATRTHFVNPHGLTADDHYTCIYDMYLIFQKAMSYDTFLDMINRKNFYAEYRNVEDGAVAVTWETTNHYFLGTSTPPDQVVISGGKTGTTEDAGGCLCLLAKDLYGNPYIAVVMHSADRDTVYSDMNRVLGAIPSA